MRPILEVKGVSKSFGGVRALDKVSLSIEKGSIVGLIGPNGSGKTTLFNVISGFYPPDEGEVYFEGMRIDGMNPNEIFRLGLVRSFQNPRLFQTMSVWENVLVVPKQRGESPLLAPFRSRWEAEEMKIGKKGKGLIGVFGLNGSERKRASDLSGGQMKLLESLRGMMEGGKLFLLDEPAAGVAPRLANEIFGFIKRLREERGLTFFIIEHRLEILMNYVDYVYVLHNGRLLAEGGPEEVVKERKVIDAYIGD